MRRTVPVLVTAALAGSILVGAAGAEKITFEDETRDDVGPGEYVYPTDSVYLPGSFDIEEVEFEIDGKEVDVEVGVATSLDDPWRMGTGFSIQMVFVFIDMDGEEGSGFTEVPPGLNFTFAPEHAWDACIILSPQPFARVNQEVEAKAPGMKDAIFVPRRVKGSRSSISGSVKIEHAKGDPEQWGFQVVMQSNEGFPAEGDLLTRKVNEYEGQHRFGGGTDYDCDPHVIDILGDHSMLKGWECNDDGSTAKLAEIRMVKP